MLNVSVAVTATAQCDVSLGARKTLPPLTNLYRSRPVRPRRSTRVFLHFACAPDYSSLTQLMREMSLKIVNNGGIVRSIQNHGEISLNVVVNGGIRGRDSYISFVSYIEFVCAVLFAC